MSGENPPGFSVGTIFPEVGDDARKKDTTMEEEGYNNGHTHFVSSSLTPAHASRHPLHDRKRGTPGGRRCTLELTPKVEYQNKVCVHCCLLPPLLFVTFMPVYPGARVSTFWCCSFFPEHRTSCE